MSTVVHTQPLWQQLLACSSVIEQVQRGRSATALLAELPPSQRPGVQALAFQVLRQLGRAQALRRRLAPRKPATATDALLCTALALAWREDGAPYEVHTLVNQTVQAAKSSHAVRGQAGFVNACLRRFLRERTALVALTEQDPVARWNHPSWWIDRLKNEWPDAWEAILEQNNLQAPMSLRVNVRQSSVADYVQALANSGIVAWQSGEYGVTLAHAVPVADLPGFAQGMVSVQDVAAQLAAPLLLGQWPLGGVPVRVLDACAAPGGKTAHLLELADLEVTALDVDAERCGRVRQTLQRIGRSATVLAADAAQPATWWDGRAFDAILLDAPCTASGIVRRHPDVRWLRRETDIAQLVAQQARLLKALWPLLRPGGRLLYCTCSVFRAEGQQQVQTFLAHNSDAALRESPGHLVPQSAAKQADLPDNQRREHDGFYYALLEKRHC